MSMTAIGYGCGSVLGFVGGAAASVVATMSLWPLIVGAIPGAGGVVLAAVSAFLLVYPTAMLGSYLGAWGLGAAGLVLDGIGLFCSAVGGDSSRSSDRSYQRISYY